MHSRTRRVELFSSIHQSFGSKLRRPASKAEGEPTIFRRDSATRTNWSREDDYHVRKANAFSLAGA